MTDTTVARALRSDAPLVVIEAPAGCGKTYQGAQYARDLIQGGSVPRTLILTHTHAACSVFAERTADCGRQAEIRTIDSLVADLAGAYHRGLGLPADIGSWLRGAKGRHRELSSNVAALIGRHPHVAASIAERFPVAICDEHQDCADDQHEIILALRKQGAHVRVFADPMQRIFSDGPREWSWGDLQSSADAFESLDTPHRWMNGGEAELGEWTLGVRSALMAGKPVTLSGELPRSVEVVVAENAARKYGDYALSPGDRRPVDSWVGRSSSLLLVTPRNRTARSLRAMFNRRLPLWEGHTREATETLARSLASAEGDREAVARAALTFLQAVGVGFGDSNFGNVFQTEVAEGCRRTRRGKPAAIQRAAECVVAQPDHRGVARMLALIGDLIKKGEISGLKLDCAREFYEFGRLAEFEKLDDGIAETHRRRTHARPKPPPKAISTVHKAKGLECRTVILMPIDVDTFPDKESARHLFYVAISRATHGVLLVVSKDRPSPLVEL